MSKKKQNLASAFDEIRADYDMSRESRFVRRRTGLAPQGGTADYHYRSESKYYDDIEKARDMDRNDAVISQTTDRAVSNIIQDGFSLDPKTGDAALDQELWSRFWDWASNPDACDVAGEFSFHDFETYSTRAMMLDGDCVVLGTQSGGLQFLEAHTIQTTSKQPNTFLGVTLDDYRKRLQYWVKKDALTPNQTKATSNPVSVRDSKGSRQLFHVYRPRRATQTRGVTAYAPVFQIAGMFEDINFAKVVQQQIVSCIAIFRMRSAGVGSGPPTTVGYGETSIESTGSGTRQIEGLAPGMEIIGAEGETLQGFSPNVPNAEYFQHAKLLLQLIGVNLGLPLCLVLMDGSETNFSGWRGAVDEARKGFKSNQVNLIKRFHRPVYEFKVRQFMMQDTAIKSAFDRGVNVFAHEWNPPTWQYIDPVGDAQGDILRLQNALTSPRRLHSEGGRDWETVADETVSDYAYAIQRAKIKASEMNAQFPDSQPVHWRELMPVTMPSGMQLTMQDPGVVEAQKTQAETAKAGTGEMASLNRRQFQNNQKAITDLLNQLIEGSMSEARVRVGLSALGLGAENIDLLITDAKDGTIDTEGLANE